MCGSVRHVHAAVTLFMSISNLNFLHPRNQSWWSTSDLQHPGVAGTEGQIKMNRTLKLAEKQLPNMFKVLRFLILTPVWCELI